MEAPFHFIPMICTPLISASDVDSPLLQMKCIVRLIEFPVFGKVRIGGIPESVNPADLPLPYLGGGGQLCRSFLQEDLVDDLFLGLGPVLLGDGIPGFPGRLAV